MNIVHTLKKRHLTATRLARALARTPLRRLGVYSQILMLPRDGAAPTAIRADFNGQAFTLRLFSFRETVPFYEVFAASEYAGSWGDCRVILDVGANVGASSLFFLSQAPQASITAFEPDKNNLQRLRLNLAGQSRVTIVPKAMAATSGRMAFNCTDGFNLGSSLVCARPGFRAETVEAVSLDDHLAQAGQDRIDLLKFDIEGAEFGMFAASRRLECIRRFIGEYHEDLAQKPIDAFLRLFPRHIITYRKIAPSRYICQGRLAGIEG